MNKEKGNVCPKCNSEDLYIEYIDWNEEHYIVIINICQNCDTTFESYYDFIKHEIIEEEE